MGGQTPGSTCGYKLGGHWVDKGTNCRSRNTPHRPLGSHPSAETLLRRRATSLRAEDARVLLKAKLPFVLKKMTDAQIHQMQRVCDAAVVDPEIRKEAQKYYDRAGVFTDEGSAIWDEAAKRKADRIMAGFIQVDDWDKRIRLDYQKLMEPTALDPITDNPDEACYLRGIKQTLDQRGVWLRFEEKLIRDPEDPSAHILDVHHFDVWLSLGPSGDTIRTETGKLTRDALLNTTELGAEYYEKVYLGPVQKALEREISRLDSQISTGRSQHESLRQLRAGSPIVSRVSDVMGGADFPDYSMWDPGFKLYLRARELNIGGNVKASQAYLMTAAYMTRTCAAVLADYLDKNDRGSGRAVTILKVLKTCGQVAGAALAVTGAVGIARAGIAALTEGSAVGTTSELDVVGKKALDEFIAKNPETAEGLKEVQLVPGPKGSITGFVKGGHSYGASAGGWGKWP